MQTLLRVIVPLCALSMAVFLPLETRAQTAPGGASSAGNAPAGSSHQPAPVHPNAGSPRSTNAANPGTSGSTTATESLLQQMQQQCGAMTDTKARNACEENYRRRMAGKSQEGNRPGQFQYNNEAPGKPQ